MNDDGTPKLSETGRPAYETVAATTIKGNVVSDDGSAENKLFFTSSPSGSIEINCVVPGVFDYIRPGDCIYCDITKAATA